ncbi:MAG: sterol desaturase family protein [Bryobacteraceae bacterium]|nr:sterol desaturase family protein [Bryobacteraceae bacterium]
MVYSLWLFGFSVLFLVAERFWPQRAQRTLRAGIGTDVFYLIFNSEYLGVLLGVVAAHTIAVLDRSLDLTNLRDYFCLGAISGQPLWLQLPALILIFDFAQWLIHNALHRVPWLWEFHKVHHSIQEMDWVGNWRFHWFEVVFYRTLLYVPAAFFGFSPVAMFWYGVLNTVVGHFAHANLSLRLGPLKYFVNSPEMHIWHHAHPLSGPADRNFGIMLSVWDWLFGTAYCPQGDPARLGFTGVEWYPKNPISQAVAPFLPQRGEKP